MPKISQKRWEEIDELQVVLAVLNGKYSYLQILEYIHKKEGKNLLEEDSDSEQRYIAAEYALRDNLRRWVNEWRKTRQPPLGRDRDGYVGDYIYKRPKLREQFITIAKQLGISADTFRPVLAFQRRHTMAKDTEVKLLVRIFRYMLEDVREVTWTDAEGTHRGRMSAGFLNSDAQLLGAEAEAMRLFMVLLRSDLSRKLGKCALPKCDNYFLNLGGRREFCSRLHAQARVNSRALRRLKEERNQKKRAALVRATTAMNQCRAQHWKHWVAKRAKVSLNFLTRNINTGELKVAKEILRRSDDL